MWSFDWDEYESVNVISFQDIRAVIWRFIMKVLSESRASVLNQRQCLGTRCTIYYPPAHSLPGCTAYKTCFGQCCTGSGIYVLQLRRHLWFASVHGMPSPSHHFSGNPMCRPQQLQVIIIHWTCWHVCGDPSPTWGDPKCVLHFMFNFAALGAFSTFSYNYFWSLCCEIM